MYVGLRVGSHLVLTDVHLGDLSELSQHGFAVDDSTINIVLEYYRCHVPGW